MSPITVPFLFIGFLILIVGFVCWFSQGFALGYYLSGRWTRNPLLRILAAVGSAIAFIVVAVVVIFLWRWATEPAIDRQKWVREHRHMVPPKDWERANQEWEKQTKKPPPK